MKKIGLWLAGLLLVPLIVYAANTSLSDMSTTPASNTSVQSVSIAEGMPPSSVNDGMRAMIAQSKGALLAVTSGGAANVQTATYAPIPDAYLSGWLYPFKAGFTNTASATMNVNGLGAKTIKKMTAAGTAALVGGEIVLGGFYTLRYDGTDLILEATPTTEFKVSSFTRDVSTASGTQAVTGVGFKPRAVVLFAGISTTSAVSVGLDDGTGAKSIANAHASLANTWNTSTGASLNLIVSGTATYTGNLTSLDSDGFTVTWTKGGTPTGTATVMYLAFK